VQWGDPDRSLNKANILPISYCMSIVSLQVHNYVTAARETCYDSCSQQEEEVSVTSTLLPSASILPASSLYCTVVQNVRDTICQVVWSARSPRAFQSNSRRAVLEEFYTGQFGCQLFERQSSCSVGDREHGAPTGSENSKVKI
jgi:hypothetical protein